MAEIKVKVSDMLLKLGEEDFRQLTGLSEAQIQMLRVVVEDCLGIDPALLQTSEIAERMAKFTKFASHQ